MSALARTGYVAAAVTFAAMTLGCGASASDDPGSFGDQEDESGGEAMLGKADGPGSPGSAHAALLAQFEKPALTAEEQAAVLDRYSDIDADGVVPRDLLERALVYYDFNLGLLENAHYLTVIDFSQHSSKRRMYIVDMESGAPERHVVAHGSGSDPENDGIPSHFSNVPNSNASSLGFYLTAETYYGKHGLSLRLDGLSETNSKVRPRAVVVHGASYVVDGKSKQGRSWGCPAVPTSEKDAVIAKIKEGSLMYAELSAD
jgi:L,D-transpeptidase catalytic domain